MCNVCNVCNNCDICRICSISHQISVRTESSSVRFMITMGMHIRPSKSLSLSIQSGSSEDVPFHIADNRIPSIRDEEQKFLGRLLFFSGKSEETFKHTYEILKEALEHIEASLIRSEYKLWIL